MLWVLRRKVEVNPVEELLKMTKIVEEESKD
jgi:hypothetical protein